MTKQQDLHMRLQQKDQQLGTMKSVLHKMQHGSDTDAMELLARLRLGESVEELANIRKEYSSTVCMHQASGKIRNAQGSAPANDAMRLAHRVSPRPDLVHRTHVFPCIEETLSGFSDEDRSRASVLCKLRLSSHGYPTQPQMWLESGLLSSSAADDNLNDLSKADTQGTQAMLSTSHPFAAYPAGEIHPKASPLSGQAFQQYPCPVLSSMQATPAYYFASSNNTTSSNGAETFAIVQYPDTCMRDAAIKSCSSEQYSMPFPAMRMSWASTEAEEAVQARTLTKFAPFLPTTDGFQLANIRYRY